MIFAVLTGWQLEIAQLLVLVLLAVLLGTAFFMVFHEDDSK